MKKITHLFPAVLVALIFCTQVTKAQSNIGIGTPTPAASAKLEISSTTQGMLTPRMTTAQRNAIASPATGLFVYQTDAPAGFQFFNGTTWAAVGSSASSLYPPAVYGHNSNSSNGYTSLYTTANPSGTSVGFAYLNVMYFPTATTITVNISSLVTGGPLSIGLYNAVFNGVAAFTEGTVVATTTINASTGTFQTGTLSASLPAGALITLRASSTNTGIYFTQTTTQ